MRLVQLQTNERRAVALVDEPVLRLLRDASSVYELAQEAITSGASFQDLVRSRVTDETISYDSVYQGESDWRLLTPLDHPDGASRCLVSGTGLTHLGSAKSRQSMHTMKEEQLTDSMIMFRWGVEGGKPAAGHTGTAPEWFYKGDGSILRAHGEALDVPAHAEDGGEEAEIAGIYLVDASGRPIRIGMAAGNEFSDHKFEKRNYLNLAGSKIRTCSLGPELVIDPSFASVPGKVSILREGREQWAKDILTGEDEMCHSLANLEVPSFQVREPPAAGRPARPLLWRLRPEFRGRRGAGRWRRHGNVLRGLRPGSSKSGSRHSRNRSTGHHPDTSLIL